MNFILPEFLNSSESLFHIDVPYLGYHAEQAQTKIAGSSSFTVASEAAYLRIYFVYKEI